MNRDMGQMTDELLVKYLLEEANEAEQQQVNAWITASVENKKYYDHFSLVWEKSKKHAVTSTVDTDTAWQKFQQRVQQNEASSAKIIEMPRRQMGWMRIAAMLVVLLGSAWMLYNIMGIGKPEMIAIHSEDKVLIDTLPDGSIVTLNKNSSLSYPASFKGNSRDIALTGEAFFDVTPDKSKPFIISVNDVKVRVVGTTFNVKHTDERTEVVVETGIVEVSKKDKGIKVMPKEKAVVLKDKAMPVKENSTDELYNYYRTREFVCNGTPLWRLVDVLNEVYNADIVIEKEQLKNLPLTTTFHNETLDSILSVVGETFNIKVERNGNRIILK